MKKLRLLLFEDCDRHCPGCCNKDWDLKRLPVCTDYSPYDIIMLTGGEPLLRPDLVASVIGDIRKVSSAKIFVYTAQCSESVADLMPLVDGVTLTLHEQRDVEAFKRLDFAIKVMGVGNGKSLRLNVFIGIDLGSMDLSMWEVKAGINWIKDCLLPNDEEFMRLSSKSLNG